MEFTRIQDKDTSEIIQYRIDGARVTRGQYLSEEQRQRQHGKIQYQYMSSFTNRTRTGNFKHSYSSNW